MMFKRILDFIRKIEKFFLRLILVVSAWITPIFRKVASFCSANKKAILKNSLISIVALYVIGGVAFGIRLYAQQKSEPIDLLASDIYPFPVASAGRSILFSKELLNKMVWAKTFALKTQNEVSTNLAGKIIDDMVSDAIGMQQADRLGMRVYQKDIDDRFDYVISGIGTQDQASQYVQEYYGMTLDQLKKQAIPKIALEKIKDEKFVKYKIRHILITDSKKAEEVAKKISDGQNFADLAKEYSEDTTSKDSGGLLADGEYIYLDSGLIPEVQAALVKLQTNEVSPIIKSSMGNHIIKVEEKSDGIMETMDDWIAGLKKDFPVRVWIK